MNKCQRPPEQADMDKLRRILKNVRKRLRQVHKIVADGETTDAKKVKKMRFVANLLLPSSGPTSPEETA